MSSAQNPPDSDATPNRPDAAVAAADPSLREVRYTISRDFLPVLQHLRASLLISTYQAGKLVAVGQAGGQLVLSLHNFERAMGVAVGPRGKRIAVGARGQIWFLDSASELASQVEPRGRYDGCFLTRQAAGHREHPRARDGVGRGRIVGREYAVLVPVYAARQVQFCASLASALRQRVGRRGPLPSERLGRARRASGVRDGHGPVGRASWLAAHEGDQRLCARRRQRRDRRTGPGHAALATLVQRPAVGVGFRNRAVSRGRRPGGPSRHGLRSAWLYPRPGVLRPVRVCGHVQDPGNVDLRRCANRPAAQINSNAGLPWSICRPVRRWRTSSSRRAWRRSSTCRFCRGSRRLLYAGRFPIWTG